MNLSIIIFCYNEESNVGTVIARCQELLVPAFDTIEMIVVNDGSTDATARVIKEICVLHPEIKVITHPENLGIGRALRSGYDSATMEYVCAIPGDGQFDVSELLHIKPFYNRCYYSFYRPKTDYNAYRRLLSWLNRLFNQHALGIFLRDVNWIKVYRKEQLIFTELKLNSSLIESEICAKLYKAGASPIEIPSNYNKRLHGIAKGGNWKTLQKAIREMATLWWYTHNFTKQL